MSLLTRPQLQMEMRQRQEQTSRRLEQLSGGQSLCRLHKENAIGTQLKYAEGADYLYRRLLRLLDKDGSQAQLLDELDRLEQKHLAMRQSPVLSGADWQAYAEGVLAGVAEVRALVAQLTPSE